MSVPNDFVNGALMGLSGFNEAVFAGLTNTQIAAATGVSNLRSVIETLALGAGWSQDDLYRASRGIQLGANAGVLTDTNIQNSSTAADIRALFTAQLPDVASTYTGFGPQ
jgi:hypothetical protein